jgi:hypothetical protein
MPLGWQIQGFHTPIWLFGGKCQVFNARPGGKRQISCRRILYDKRMFKTIQKEIKMFTNRLFTLIVAAVIVVVAVQLISVAGSPAAKPIDHSAASKYEGRYDRMNNFPDADSLYSASKYADRYNHMNDFPGTDRPYIVSKYEDRYDRMNDLP